jgi:hypothetical protein
MVGDAHPLDYIEGPREAVVEELALGVARNLVDKSFCPEKRPRRSGALEGEADQSLAIRGPQLGLPLRPVTGPAQVEEPRLRSGQA